VTHAYVWVVFVRRKKNKSGSTSVFILKREKGKQVLIKSMGSSKSTLEIASLEEQACLEIIKISTQSSFAFGYDDDKKHIED